MVRTVEVAEVTKHLALANDPACLLFDTTTPEGRAAGIATDSVVSCLLLMTVYSDTVEQTLGTLSPALKARLDDCLKAALALT